MTQNAQIRTAILDLKDPHTNVAWHEMGVEVDIDIVQDEARIHIILPYPAAGAHDALAQSIHAHLVSLGVELPKELKIGFVHRIADKKAANKKIAPSVKNIIAVGSGKGGVGKSTTAVNLAFALQAEGARVGILDADIYGPSVPTLLGTKDAQPTSPDGKHIAPVMVHGLASMSLGYLVDEKDAVIWRGPMASGALQQLMNDTLWPELDYLVLDLPPGTGDVQLTMAQRIPVSGALVVTTPQDLALVDARKAVAMFKKVSIPVLGICENMSIYVCPNCGHEASIFGEGGAEKLEKDFNIPVVGRLPLNPTLRAYSDSGRSVILDPEQTALAEPFRHMARCVAARLALTNDQPMLNIHVVED